MSAWLSAITSNLNDLYSPSAAGRLSSQPTDSFSVALTSVPSWAARIFDKVAELVRHTPQAIPSNDRIVDFLATYPSASFTSAAVLILSVFFVAYRYLMTDRNSYGWPGGRGSPYLVGGGYADPQRNLSGHFEYIDADDDLYTRHRPSNTQLDYSVIDDNDPNAPDRVHVRYMASQFAVDFPPYSISEATATVKDLRRKIADRLDEDPARIRLLYKSRELKNNRYSLKKYRMKQNSEVVVVVTERPTNYDDRNSPSESGSDSGSGANQLNSRRQTRPRSHSSVRFRSDEQVPKLQTNGNAFLSPNGHVPSTPIERRHRESLRPTESLPRDQQQRAPSRGPEYRESVRTQDRSDVRKDQDASHARGSSPAPAAASQVPSADPSTPVGKLQALSSTFHTVWLPQCMKFTLNPPTDPETRRREHLKLSESVMQYIVDQADAIDLEGNVDARTMRKTLINEANAVIKKLDLTK